jgi:LPS export ABC transporter protein LptC
MNWRKLVPLLLLPALGGLLYTFQRMDSSDLDLPEQPVSLPRYSLGGAELTRYDIYGNPALHGTAENIDYFDNQSGAARNLQMELLSPGGSAWRLAAPSAELPSYERRLRLNGPVQASGHWPDTGEELTLSTDHLWVDPDNRQFDTDAPLSLQSPGRSGSATGLRADWAGRNLQLQHDVKMNYEVPPP